MADNQAEVNNLKKFGTPFQAKCLAAMLSDRAFLERIIDIVSPEYFETDAHKWVVKFVSTYFPAYRDIPTMSVFACEIMQIQDPLMQIAVREQVKMAYNEVSTAKDLKYVKEQFLGFCRNQKLKNAIWASQVLLKEGDYEGIWHVINEASKAGMERNLGHEYLAEMDQRMSAMAREVIKTNWSIIDTHLDGGLGKGELGFVVAPAGSGKSWFLAHIGAEAMLQGKNVMHFTMELNEKYVGLRYDSIFSGVAFQEVRKNQPIIQKKLDEIKSKGCGKLFIKYFPTKTASAATLKMHIERLQLITGVKIDLVIVDYADLLRPFMQERNSNSYNEAGNVYDELRGMLGELQVPGWTASQANRGVHEEDIIEAMGVADSYRKIMIGDFIMSLSRKKEDKMAGTGRIYVMKNRFGPDGVWYPCAFDTSCGKVDIFEKNSVEGMEVLSRVKTAEEQLKEIFGKRWKETHDNDGPNGS
jgi:replicative DNA helicase